MGRANQMHQRIAGAHLVLKRRRVERIADDRRRTSGYTSGRARSREYAHVVSEFEQRANQPPPDIPRSARHEHTRHGPAE
jgi:hypothetical protein